MRLHCDRHHSHPLGDRAPSVYLYAMLISVILTLVAAQAPVWPPVDDPVAATGGGDKDAAVVVGVSEY